MSQRKIEENKESLQPPRMSVRVEYVGIIAVACLIGGIIIGSQVVDRSPAKTAKASAKGGLEAMTAQIDAIDDYDQLVQIGNQAFDAGNPHVAIPAYEKALRIGPGRKDPNVVTDLGVMYRAIGEYGKAVALFRQAMQIDPKHAFSRYNLGVVLMQDLKDYPGAKAAFEEFLRLSPGGPEAESAKKNLKELEKLGK